MSNIGFCLYNTSMSSYVLDRQSVYLKNENSLFVFHIDTLTTDRSTNTLNNNYCVPLFDISFMSISEIIKLIKSLNIEVFVFFTFQSVLDKFIWSTCQILNIPTIIHDHGLVYGSSIARIEKPKKTWIAIRRKLSFSLKQFQVIVFSFYRKKNILKMKFEFDHYLIYSMTNLDYYRNFFLINESNTTISGIPLFDNEIEFNILKKTKKERKLLYLHQPFIKLGMSSLSIEKEIEYINKLNITAKSNDLKLVIRLHPSHSIEEYKKFIWDTNIIFENKEALEKQSASAFAIIGHWSTALTISLPLEIPLIIIEYPQIKDEYKQFYSIYKDVSFYCENIKQLQNTLMQIQLNNTENNQLKIKRLIGTVNTVESDCEKLTIIIDNIKHKTHHV